ncbi:MAG: heat-inducible transcriptional repressor HrcA [Nitrospiraceae bacterium]|nr:heat-inducible transcriptional repressor HrcA [Nitrospiraceae bacterium]
MLNKRTEQVLFAIVQSYIASHEPVGSRFVTKKYSFNLSPATIRNIMADLEELGFLIQPHTSAGRVPTDRGYRFYVDYLPEHMAAVEEKNFLTAYMTRLESLKEDLNGVIEGAAKTLSENSSYIGVSAPLKPEKTTLNRVELFSYKGRHIAVMLLTNEGIIKHKLIRMEQEVSPRTLRRISDYLNQEFAGYGIDDIRLRLVREMSKEKAFCDILITKAMEICREALTFPAGDIYMYGLPEFIGLPDFSDRIKEIARAIEDKHLMVRLLEKVCQEPGGASVLIGSENPVKEMRGLSMVLAPYGQGGRPAGTVGIIGPTRMDYNRAITMVEATARFITDFLSDGA